jgi:lysophospholipase L1-like esterase
LLLGILLASAAACGRGLDRDGDGVVTVVCLGDSNTRGGAFARVEEGWCERLGADGAWRTVNRGRNGATACEGDSSLLRAIDRDGTTLEDALAADHADVAILAIGTNDVVANCTPEETLDAIRRLVARIDATGAEPLVALVPPTFPPEAATKAQRWNRQYARLNDALRAHFRGRIVDFTDVAPSDYVEDNLHINAEGQRKRADAARAALLALAGR